MLSCISVTQLLHVSVFTQKKKSTSTSFRKRNLLSFNGFFKVSFRLDHSANLEGRGSSGKFELHFHGSEHVRIAKQFGRVIYASETIQNCKTLQAIDTLSGKPICLPTYPHYWFVFEGHQVFLYHPQGWAVSIFFQ